MQMVFLPSEQTPHDFPALKINISEFSDSVLNHFVPICRKIRCNSVVARGGGAAIHLCCIFSREKKFAGRKRTRLSLLAILLTELLLGKSI